jgi:glycosyltransferase involved in cell wall biosynthesis
MADPQRSIIAIIPAFQEGPRIEAVVVAASRHLPVLVVDDGSSDDTASRAASAGATVLRQEPNAGKGAALRRGFRHAMERDAAAVVTLDADGQHDPDEIPSFLAAFERSHPGLVIGQRDFRAMPPIRRLSNTVGGAVLSAAVGQRIRDNQSGYRLISRGLLNHLVASDEDGFEFEVEMIARCIALGLPIRWVPIQTIYAGAPSHIEPLRHLTEFVRVTRQARRIARPG